MTATPATATTTAASTPKVKRTRKPKTEAPAPLPATIGGELKLAVAQEQLKRGLTTVSHALSGKSTLPVLSNVLLASDGPTRLKLSATDLLIGITVSIPATVEQAGAITLPGKLLADLVGDLPNDTIALTMQERTQSVTLACREFEATIKGIAAEEYPIIPAFTESTPAASFSADALKSALAQVVFAASSDDTRPVLTGVRVALSGSTAAFTAADTFRVAFHDLALTTPVAIAQEVVIPAPALATLKKLLGDCDTSIEMVLRADGAMVLFRSQHLELITRVIDGTYPKTDKFRTNRPLTRLVMAKADLTRAVKLAACFATASPM